MARHCLRLLPVAIVVLSILVAQPPALASEGGHRAAAAPVRLTTSVAGRMTALTGSTTRAAGAPTWYPVTPAYGPIGRDRQGLAYDPAIGATVLFGGYNPYTASVFYADTWLFANDRWTEISPTVAPPARATFGLTWDSSESTMLLFGGHTAYGDLNDTWVLSANESWQQVPTSVAPSPREGVAMCDDPADGGVLLFGGDSGASSAPGMTDTWLFHAGSWHLLHPTVTPPGRTDTACAWDSADQEVVMFSGGVNDPPTATINDTWVYRSGDWSQVMGNGPAGRLTYSLGASPSGGVLLFSEGCASACNDTWEFLAGQWQELAVGLAPAAVTFGTLSFDPAANVTISFGGASSTGWTNATWEFAIPELTVNASSLSIDTGMNVSANVTIAPEIGPDALEVSWGDPNGYSVPAGSGPSWSVSHRYSGAGGFVAEFNVTDQWQRSTSLELSVAVAALPTVSVSAIPTTGALPLTVTFNVSVAGGTGPFNWSWEAGDGNSSTVADQTLRNLLLTHDYTRNGSFQAKFTVTDAVGATASGLANLSTFIRSNSSGNGPGSGSGSGTGSGSLLSGNFAGLPILDWIAIAAVAAVLAGVGGALLMRRRAKPPSPRRASAEADAPASE